MNEQEACRAAVHATHCCTRHGCKYGDASCPVVRGTARQEYPCEYCGEQDTEDMAPDPELAEHFPDLFPRRPDA